MDWNSTLASPVCVLISGGLDSGLLLWRFLQGGQHVAPLYIRCGFWWEDVELFWLRRFLRAVRSPRLLALEIVDAPMHSVYGAHWSLTGRRMPGARSADRAVYLPGRNLLLLSYAAIMSAQHRYAAVALGVLRGNPFRDASPQFLTPLSACLRKALHYPIRIMTPLRHTAKPDLIRRAAGAPLRLTFSCLRPVGQNHCGHCNKCAERVRAFRDAKMPDPTRYAWSPTGRARGTGTPASMGATSRPPVGCRITVSPTANGRGAMAGS